MMKGLFLALSLATAASTCAYAQTSPDQALLSQEALRCMNLMPRQASLDWHVEMDVHLAILGQVEAVDVIAYGPDDDEGRGIAQKAAEAVVGCSPYSVNLPGTIRIVLPDMSEAVSSKPPITLPERGTPSTGQ